MKTIFKAALAATTLGFAACGADPSVMDGYKAPATQSPTTQSQSGHDVQISSAYIKPPFGGRTTAAGFFTVQNKGGDARLVSASSPISDTVEIHTHLEEDGVMKMRRVDGVDLPAGATIEFKPGGYHIMMFNTVLADDQTEAPVTLTYADGTVVTLLMDIGDGPSDDMKAMDHSGH